MGANEQYFCVELPLWLTKWNLVKLDFLNFFFYLVEIDVDKLVEVGVDTLDDVEADDEVDALRIEMINYFDDNLVNTSAGSRP